jgi:hypothetical protein
MERARVAESERARNTIQSGIQDQLVGHRLGAEQNSTPVSDSAARACLDDPCWIREID